MKNYIRFRGHALLAISFSAFLLVFSACSKPEFEPLVSDEPDSSFEAVFDAQEDLQNIPEYASVKEAIDAQNWVLAEKKLTSLLKPADPHPAFANDLGFVLMQQQQWKRAVAAFKQAISLDPRYERAFYNLGISYRKLNDLNAAESAYRSAVEINPYYNEAWFNLGLLLYSKNALDEAKQAFLQITENTRTSRFSRAFYQLGLISAQEGNDAEAIDFYDQSILLTPSHVPSYLNKGAALLRLDLLEKAHETLVRAQALSPDDSLVLWNLGLVAYKQAKFEEAHDLFHRVAYASDEPPNAEAHYMLGKAFSEQGELNAAINEYEFALKIRPDYPEAAFNLALNLDRSGDEAAGIALYQKLADSENASAESLNNLAAYYLAQGEDASAISLLERAIRLDPTYSTGYYNLGLAELRLEDFDKAVDAFSHATELEPSNFAGWKNLGISYARKENIESALEAMQQAHLLDPADADTAVYVVKYLKLLDRPEEAMTEVYRLSYDHGARNPLILRHLAQEAFAREDFESAVNFYQEYIKLRPTPAYYFSLGLSLRKMNRFEEAKAAYLEAVKLRPSYSKAWLNLGYIHAFLNDPTSARAAFEKALELEPDYTNAIDAIRELEAGEIHP